MVSIGLCLLEEAERPSLVASRTFGEERFLFLDYLIVKLELDDPYFIR